MDALSTFYQDRASAFIKTVVCFDDKAEYRLMRPNTSEALVATRVDDGFFGAPSESREFVENDVCVIPASDELDARALTEAFADRGILCSVIIPHTAPDAIDTQISTLAKSADITILDWKLGEITPRDSIAKIIEEDNAAGGKLRLIIIFSDADPASVMTDLASVVHGHGFVLDEGGREFSGPHARIVFFSKPGAAVSLGPVVTYEKLPEEVIKEFTKLTSGLLPAAALTAITEIREHTHHLIATFSSTLDGAFLTHRCLIPDPNDSEQFLLDLLEGEIGSILHKSNVREAVNSDRCCAWVTGNDSISSDERKIVLNALQNYRRNNKTKGFQKLFCSEKEKEVAEKVLELFYKTNPSNLSVAKRELSVLATLDACGRQAKAPRLQLGAIVKDHSQSKYLLCIQPLCDSLRIKHDEAREFPFLVLENYDFRSDQSSLELCIPHRNETLWLTVKTLPKNLITYPFNGKSATEGFVEACSEGGSYFFKNSDSSIKLEWLAALKIGKAQRIASQLAARIHTLGIDEFEWLRLHQRQ